MTMRKTDLKKHIFLFLVTVSTIFLCSCSSHQASDTYFIHAIGFDKQNDEYILLSLCEKYEKDNKEYFLIRQSGNDIKQALDNTQNQYKDCYFATAEYYFISSECDYTLIYDIADEICDSNTLPSKSDICMISGQSVESFMTHIKNSDDMKKIKKELEGKAINTVNFFSHYTSGKDLKISVLSIQNDGTITAPKKVISSYGKGNLNEHFKR